MHSGVKACIKEWSIAHPDFIEVGEFSYGNPARIIRYRFSHDIIEYLLRIKWWNWPLERIKRNVKLLCSDQIADLMELNNDNVPDMETGMKRG
jgi:hypothetical protein